MDSLGGYVGGNPRPLTKKEMERMKKIMRRVPAIKQKNDEYHKKEEQEADDFFSKKLDEIN